MQSRCAHPVFVAGDKVVVRWIFRFDWRDGSVTEMEELACQRRGGERIAEAQFFYDPAQARAKPAHGPEPVQPRQMASTRATKPSSEGRTISMLAGPTGEFRIECSLDAPFPPEQTLSAVLREPGDDMLCGAGIHHCAFGLQRSTILTIRWTPST